MTAPTPALSLVVYVQPRAAKSELAGLHDGVPRIRLRAPAVDDAANLALVEFVAVLLGVPRRSVRIASGLRSRRKRLEITGVSAQALQRSFGSGDPALSAAPAEAPGRNHPHRGSRRP